MKWEYKAVRILINFPDSRSSSDNVRLSEALDEYGEKRWELVNFHLEQDCFIFKRIKLVDLPFDKLYLEEETS